MVYSIELKFGIYILGQSRTNPIDFSECKMHNFFFLFFKGAQKSFLIYYGLWNQIIKSVLMSKRCTRLNLNLMLVYYKSPSDEPY